MNNVIFTKEGGIAKVLINRPKALNALNSETLQELQEIFLEIKGDSSVKVVILSGEGDKAFVAGADIAEMATLTPAQGKAFGELGNEVFSLIENIPQPTIAAVNGFALGGGCELSMACDIRIASENALFGQPEVGLGITPGFGGTQRLPRLIGEGRAKELIFLGSKIDATEAYRIGLVNKVVALEELMSTCEKIAEKLLRNSMFAISCSKEAIHKGLDMDLKNGLAMESALFGMTFSHADQTEGMNAFLEKRKPEFHS